MRENGRSRSDGKEEKNEEQEASEVGRHLSNKEARKQEDGMKLLNEKQEEWY